MLKNGWKERADNVEYYCNYCGGKYSGSLKRKYCSDDCARAARREEAVADFEVRFNNQFNGRYVYLSGYAGSESTFDCRCLACGSILHRSAQCVRLGHADILCENCALTKRSGQLAVRKAQRIEEHNNKAKDKEAQREAEVCGVCKECGKRFKGNRAGLKYCSDECKRKHNNRYHEIGRREKIKKNGEIDYTISLQRLVKRDKYICHICGESVDMKTDTNADIYGSIDHVIPINKGGTHTWDNVKLAHRLCNAIKSDTSIYRIERGQIALCL